MNTLFKVVAIFYAILVLVLFALRLIRKAKVIREAYHQGYTDAQAGIFNRTLQNHHKHNLFTDEDR